jgi:hypothetical protein
MKKIDLKGKIFGRLTVIEEAGKNKYGAFWWKCKCECGNIKKVYGMNLTRGLTKSCGCLRIEKTVQRSTTHGKFHTFAYKVWADMLQRCNNPNSSSYQDYGGRGITVCERWQKFENFFEDMGERLYSNLTIERVDNSKGYSPDNCVWADKFVQARNKRIFKNNKTGVKGVCWQKSNKKYAAYIWIDGKQKYLGSFNAMNKAAIARKEAELKS